MGGAGGAGVGTGRAHDVGHGIQVAPNLRRPGTLRHDHRLAAPASRANPSCSTGHTTGAAGKIRNKANENRPRRRRARHAGRQPSTEPRGQQRRIHDALGGTRRAASHTGMVAPQWSTSSRRALRREACQRSPEQQTAGTMGSAIHDGARFPACSRRADFAPDVTSLLRAAARTPSCRSQSARPGRRRTRAPHATSAGKPAFPVGPTFGKVAISRSPPARRGS